MKNWPATGGSDDGTDDTSGNSGSTRAVLAKTFLKKARR
jgi:hypothetical protein